MNLLSNLFHLFYPHICKGCGTDQLKTDAVLCYHCLSILPQTNYASIKDNEIERLFSGRIKIQAAFSQFYFSKGKLIQYLIHRLKYQNDLQVGSFLGEMIGQYINNSNRFNAVNYLIPMPLYKDKEKKRGYNQATILCEGISKSTTIPVLTDQLIRIRPTETQTKKNRMERWLNVQNGFAIKNPESLEGCHLLLVDDVITTGASMEACANTLLQIPGCTLSLLSLAHAEGH